ncbi:hypothetical protein MUK42_24149 [Musa troglodytarum]|uniref:Protein TIC 21, chloroplastic n=1 Tax=Musa troglodytarum TaxID=320322 RepID=A0A9E7K0H9_9LILI|nr:hypothetical protein MUK42_24149 [Musa troglodytarum]
MQALLRPTSRSTAAPLLRPASSPSLLLPHLPSTPCTITPLFLRRPYVSTSSEALSPSPTRFFPGYPSPLLGPKRGISVNAAASFASSGGKSERAKLAQASKKLENMSRYFERLGSLGFWWQLVCTVMAAVILSFSTVVTGKIKSPVTFYTTAFSVAAAFISVFWSFGYIRLSERLRRTANDPSKAPPRADVVKSLKNGVGLNLLGMGAAILGMQATVGLLFAKVLTTSALPYYQGISPGHNPVLPLDVFLVQASANMILSHFLGLVFSLELLRSVTLPHSESVPALKVA